MKYSDFELIDRVLRGNRLAFEELVNRYKKSVYYLTYRMVHDYEDAADLSQETFLKAYQGLRKFKRRSSFHTWLYRITINLCINHLRRKESRRYVGLEKVQTVKNPDVLEKLELEELQNRVNGAVNSLPEKQRAAFVLHKYEGLSYQEIAEVMQRSLSSVESLIHRAKLNLQRELVRYLT